MSENTKPQVGESETIPTGKQPGSPTRTSRSLSNNAIVAIVVVLLLVLGIGVLAGWLVGKSTSTGTSATTQSGSSAASLNALPQAVAAMFRQSVVQINVVTQQSGGLGSGTIIDNRGYIVTNYHVIEGARQIQVELYDGLQLPAQLTGIDPPDDLAVIKITPPTHMAVATIGIHRSSKSQNM